MGIVQKVMPNDIPSTQCGERICQQFSFVRNCLSILFHFDSNMFLKNVTQLHRGWLQSRGETVMKRAISEKCQALSFMSLIFMTQCEESYLNATLCVGWGEGKEEC